MTEGEEKDIMRKICQRSREGLYEDRVAEMVKELKRGRGKVVQAAEWREEMVCSFSRIKSTFLMTWTYGGILWNSIMTPIWLVIQDVGKHSS